MYGNKIKTKQQKVVKAGQFIVAESDAKYGALGVIPKRARRCYCIVSLLVI